MAWEETVQRLRITGEPAGAEISLRLAGLGDEGATELAEALATSATSVAKIDLSFNGLGDEGATALADALKHNAGMSTLILSGNRLGDEGATALADALKANASVTSLDLALNHGLGDEGVAAMADALKTNTTLSELRLDGNIIHERVVSKVDMRLQANKDLHYNRQNVSLRGPNQAGWEASSVFERIVGSFHGKPTDHVGASRMMPVIPDVETFDVAQSWSIPDSEDCWPEEPACRITEQLRLSEGLADKPGITFTRDGRPTLPMLHSLHAVAGMEAEGAISKILDEWAALGAVNNILNERAALSTENNLSPPRDT